MLYSLDLFFHFDRPRPICHPYQRLKNTTWYERCTTQRHGATYSPTNGALDSSRRRESSRPFPPLACTSTRSSTQVCLHYVRSLELNKLDRQKSGGATGSDGGQNLILQYYSCFVDKKVLTLRYSTSNPVQKSIDLFKYRRTALNVQYLYQVVVLVRYNSRLPGVTQLADAWWLMIHWWLMIKASGGYGVMCALEADGVRWWSVLLYCSTPVLLVLFIYNHLQHQFKYMDPTSCPWQWLTWGLFYKAEKLVDLGSQRNNAVYLVLALPLDWVCLV